MYFCICLMDFASTSSTKKARIDSDTIEAEADKFALNPLIPEDLWDQCLSRFALSEEAVRIDAEKIGIDPSIIAGRIRKERGNYTILNDLVGQGSGALAA